MSYIFYKSNFIPDFELSIPNETFYNQLIKVKNGQLDYQDLEIPDTHNLKGQIKDTCLIIAKQDGFFILNNE